MPPMKLTNAQHAIVKNDAIHYSLSMRYSEKEQMWECDCDAATAMKVKKLVDTPAPPNQG